MSILEAIEFFSSCKYHCDNEDFHQMAINALLKQIPKKPRNYIDFDGFVRRSCPSCPRNEILYIHQKYCSVCGQKILWNDENGG